MYDDSPLKIRSFIFLHTPIFIICSGVTSGKRVPENMHENGNLQDGSIFQASSFASILFKKISLSALDVSNPELPRHVLLLLPLF